MPSLSQALSASLGIAVDVQLGSVSESTAEALFTGLASPFVIQRFRVDAQPAWLVWDPIAAIATVEAVVGASGGSQKGRALSRVEQRLLGQFLATVVERTTAALGAKASQLAIVTNRDEVGSWKDGDKGADPHRLLIELVVSGPGEPSHMLVHLPGFGTHAAAPSTESAVVPELPEHLESVELELRAALPGCDVPLSQLLALEVGDVIPLEADAGNQAIVSIDGRSVARALAIRLQELGVEGDCDA